MTLDPLAQDFLYLALYALQPALKLVMGGLFCLAFMEAGNQALMVLRG